LNQAFSASRSFTMVKGGVAAPHVQLGPRNSSSHLELSWS
jgi:hypothetical protein